MADKSIEVLSRIYQWQKYLDGSNSYQPGRTFLDGSRICREAIETNSRKFRWIEKAIRSIEKRSPRGSINRNLSRICQESIELDKKSFFKERKNTKRWMQTSKLLKHRSNQQVKLSKTSLKKNNAKHSISKTHTHTHTLNKSNQF